MENSGFETLPGDIKTEILLRLSLKSLVKFIFVSKEWASFIRSEEFKGRYLKRSTERPRVMFMIERYTSQPPEPEMLWFHSVYQEQTHGAGSHHMEALFHSVYQSEEPLLSSGQQQLRIPFERVTSCVSGPVRGLICLQLGTKVAICNPGAKTFRALPEIQADKSAIIKSFLGYDEATNVFKVLSCITCFRVVKKPITTYQVCTMGSDEESWRPITCHDQGHSPDTHDGLFKDGVVYYVATRYSDNARVIMSFNLMSEDLSVIELSEEIQLTPRWNLVNYKGEIALSTYVDYGTGVLQMWARNEMGVWLSKNIEIPPWKATVDDEHFRFCFRGTTIGTRELVFTEYLYYDNGSPYVVLFYDTETKNLRRFGIEELIKGEPSVKTFLDHVDSTWLI